MHNNYPMGEYAYLHLPMGIMCSPDIFQAKMSELMSALEFVRTYLDGLLILSPGTLEYHLDQLEKVLQKMKEAGLKVQAEK